MKKEAKVQKWVYTLKDGTQKQTGTYFFRFTRIDGGRVVVSTGLKQKRKAQSYANRYLKNLDKQVRIEVMGYKKKESSNKTLLMYLKEAGWLDWKTNPKYLVSLTTESVQYGKGKAKNTASLLNRIFVIGKDELGQVRYDAIKKSDVISFRNRLAENEMKPATKNDVLKTLSSVYAWLSSHDDNDALVVSPFLEKFAPRFKEEERKRYDFSKPVWRIMFDKDTLSCFQFEKIEDEHERVRAKAKWEKFLASDAFDMLKFMSLTGMRPQEIRALIKSQITDGHIVNINRAFKDTQNKTEEIGKPKWDKEREIVLCDSAYELIKNKLATYDDDEFMFKNERKKPVDGSRWSKKFNYFIHVVNSELNLNLPFDNSSLRIDSYCLRRTLNTFLAKYNSELRIEGHPQLVLNLNAVKPYFGWTEDVDSSLTKVQKKHYTSFGITDFLNVARVIEDMYSGQAMVWDYVDFPSSVQSFRLAEAMNEHKSKAMLNKIDSEIPINKVELLTFLRADENEVVNIGLRKFANNILHDKDFFTGTDVDSATQTLATVWLKKIVGCEDSGVMTSLYNELLELPLSSKFNFHLAKYMVEEYGLYLTPRNREQFQTVIDSYTE